jgi:DNA polymerase
VRAEPPVRGPVPVRTFDPPPTPAMRVPPQGSRTPVPTGPKPEPTVAKPTPPVIQIDEPFTAPLLSSKQKSLKLKTLDETQVKGCTRCRLCETRTQTVFGEGDIDAKLMFIGEGPGENEDLSGRPFVGRAGQLLDKMIGAMGLAREQVYIANVVKCRPPNNRAPMPDETGACTPYLLEQIETIRPQVIVTLGLPATRFILQQDLSMGRMRGQFHDWRGLKVMPTYHPSYVLRSYTPQTRAAVWSDLQQVMKLLGLKGAGKKSESI